MRLDYFKFVCFVYFLCFMVLILGIVCLASVFWFIGFDFMVGARLSYLSLGV